MNRSAVRRFLPLVAAAAVGSGAGVAAYTLSNNSSPAANTPKVTIPAQQASATSSADSLTQVYQADAPGVVDINVTFSTGSSSSSGGFNPFGVPTNPQQQPQQQAEGTGFVIDKNGDILTAEHVVDNESSIKVTFQDGSTATATLVGSDNSTDTAVIHVNVDPSKLHPLTLGNSSSVLPGQEVAAIGSPFGLPETMTSGIVSAVNRTITAPSNSSISGAIQTDAPINHGNSGGPLIDVANNTVIGINDQIESDTNDNSGVGFAVPINTSKVVAQKLISGAAYLGVEIVPGNRGGAKVGAVTSGAPAAKAGLEPGDVITALNGKPIANYNELQRAVFDMKPGDSVTLTVRRNGATKQLTVTLGTRPASVQ